METRAPYVLVGSFVLVILAGLVAAVLWFAQVQFNQQVSYYDIYVKGSVAGLNPGSTVSYSGIPVGRVAEIRLDPQDPTKVRVTIELKGGTVIRSDAVASLEQQGLTGVAFINLTGGSAAAPPLTRQGGERYPVIASRPSGLQQVVTSAPEVLARLITLADQLSDVLNEQNRQALGDTLENMRQLSQAAASHSADIDRALVDGSAAMRDLRTTVDSANTVLNAFNQSLPPPGEAQSTMKSINDATRQFADIGKRLDQLVAENQPQIKDFTRHGLDQLDQLVSQTQLLVTQLSRIADTIERDPSRLLYGDRRQGYTPQ